MKRFTTYLKFFALGFFLMLPAIGFSVTQKEMEQARTIAAKAYLRYANDGSGYLDDLNPKTMEELEAGLKTKEKENIKAFKAIPVPSDYKAWDKDKLVEYWAVTAFQDKGLLEKGRGGRIRARSQINKMTVSPPQPETPAAPAQTSPAPSPTPADSTSAQAPNPAVMQDSLKADENALLDNEMFEDPELNVDKAANYTWVYIMVLAILVAIVVALVVYAAKVLKGNNASQAQYDAHREEENEELEHLEASLAEKNTEITMLNRKLENALRQNSELKEKVDSLTAQLATIREASRIVEPQKDIKKPESTEKIESKVPLRSIYLGRANSRGIFVRADRSLNVGHSVFVLDTSDGYSGTFRVADSPAAWSLALSNPREYLESACTGHDLDDTASASRIVTESSGTAVFEGGCWRVIRKARIHYE